jgi:hypothetical protein
MGSSTQSLRIACSATVASCCGRCFRIVWICARRGRRAWMRWLTAPAPHAGRSSQATTGRFPACSTRCRSSGWPTGAVVMRSCISPMGAQPAGERHSHGVRRLAAVQSSRGSFEDATEAIAEATGLQIGKRQVELLARRAAVDFEDF